MHANNINNIRVIITDHFKLTREKLTKDVLTTRPILILPMSIGRFRISCGGGVMIRGFVTPVGGDK